MEEPSEVLRVINKHFVSVHEDVVSTMPNSLTDPTKYLNSDFPQYFFFLHMYKVLRGNQYTVKFKRRQKLKLR